jgi:hypothetical protein
MGKIADIVGTMRSTFRVGQVTLDSSGLTAARSIALPDEAGTLRIDDGSPKVTVSATEPSSPAEGDIWIDIS